jgi:inorganic pyrophosphatase
MPKHSQKKQHGSHPAHAGDLSRLPSFDKKGALLVVIETPRGCHNKYDYDPELRCLTLGKVLPEGMVFPYDFGFVPSTRAEDGDPLDVLALLDSPVAPGCIVRARPIGVIEAEQKEKGQKWIRNDRMLAVAVNARVHAAVHKPGDLRPHMLRELQEFFIDYNKLENRKFRCLRVRGPKTALQLVRRIQAKD